MYLATTDKTGITQIKHQIFVRDAETGIILIYNNLN